MLEHKVKCINGAGNNLEIIFQNFDIDNDMVTMIMVTMVAMVAIVTMLMIYI
jgi:hypothetical protein